jgi:two-component system, OmpR family, sensor histidine kinase VanS
MRTSIKSRLFLLTYGVILAFIVGLIVLNNTYLERFYTDQREKTLVSSFEELKDVDLSATSFENVVLEIESQHNINVQIVFEPFTENPPDPDGGLGSLPVPYERIFGNAMFLRDSAIVSILAEFDAFDGNPNATNAVAVAEDEEYSAFLAELTPTNITAQNQFRFLALCVREALDNGDYIYYILTVSFQSIRDNIAIFNAFTIFVGVIFMVLSGVVLYFTSSRFTTPILAMNRVTQDLANLDFSKRVDVLTNDEIGDLGDSINKMSTQLETSIQELKSANLRLEADIELKTKIDSMRKEFIASASHELKTPISLILGYSEALKLTGLEKEKIEDYLDIIIDESNKMNKLVMGLLKISQLESGFHQFSIEPFYLRDLVEESIRMFQIKLDEEGIRVKIDLAFDGEIESDYEALQTVLSNYLSNAIHHVDQRKQIIIRSYLDNEEAVVVEVENYGKQIKDTDLERIWESFYKIDKARSRQYGGQGLGLSIVRTTLSLLGYRYRAANTEQGVVFQFILPKSIHSSNNQD